MEHPLAAMTYELQKELGKEFHCLASYDLHTRSGWRSLSLAVFCTVNSVDGSGEIVAHFLPRSSRPEEEQIESITAEAREWLAVGKSLGKAA